MTIIFRRIHIMRYRNFAQMKMFALDSYHLRCIITRVHKSNVIYPLYITSLYIYIYIYRIYTLIIYPE